MTAFTFDIPYCEPDDPRDTAESTNHTLRRIVESMEESRRMAEREEARRAALPKERLITLKMPTEMIERLDAIAEDADISRSQLIRQVASDFMNYVWANGIRFRGSLMGFKHRPIIDRDGE